MYFGNSPDFIQKLLFKAEAYFGRTLRLEQLENILSQYGGKPFPVSTFCKEKTWSSQGEKYILTQSFVILGPVSSAIVMTAMGPVIAVFTFLGFFLTLLIIDNLAFLTFSRHRKVSQAVARKKQEVRETAVKWIKDGFEEDKRK